MFVGEQYGKAEEAMHLYVSAFADGRVVDFDPELKRGRFELAGQSFVALDGEGTHAFTFTPATSIVVTFDAEHELDAAYAVLAEGGAVLMPLGSYDFSPWFAWLADRYGVSWQLMLA
jgi:predicted 3-demethylubiquinone-9 3-methyltransferase (glyoxalase superfamily)